MGADQSDQPAGRPTTVRVTSRSGRIRVEFGDVDRVTVDGDATVTRAADEVLVEASTSSVSVRAPAGTGLVIGTESGGVDVDGPAGAVSVTTTSGSVTVERAESADVRTKSGKVQVGSCDEICRVRSRSGAIRIGTAASVGAGTKSGSVVVGPVGGGSVHAGSGRIQVVTTGRQDLEIKTVSGSAVIAVDGDARPSVDFLTRSGTVSNTVGDGDDFTLAIRTVSGSISVVSA